MRNEEKSYREELVETQAYAKPHIFDLPVMYASYAASWANSTLTYCWKSLWKSTFGSWNNGPATWRTKTHTNTFSEYPRIHEHLKVSLHPDFRPIALSTSASNNSPDSIRLCKSTFKYPPILVNGGYTLLSHEQREKLREKEIYSSPTYCCASAIEVAVAQQYAKRNGNPLMSQSVPCT